MLNAHPKSLTNHKIVLSTKFHSKKENFFQTFHNNDIHPNQCHLTEKKLEKLLLNYHEN